MNNLYILGGVACILIGAYFAFTIGSAYLNKAYSKKEFSLKALGGSILFIVVGVLLLIKYL